jgi:hypothetical protein
MSDQVSDWLDKRPRRALKPWSMVAGSIRVLDMRPTVRVAEDKKIVCCTLNGTGGIIWQLCDGKHSIRDLITEIAAHYGMDEKVVGSDVCNLLHRLEAAELMELDGESFF